MPDSDNQTSTGDAPFEPRHLPVPVPAKRENGDGWIGARGGRAR